MFGRLAAASASSPTRCGGSRTACGHRPRRRRPSVAMIEDRQNTSSIGRSSCPVSPAEQSARGHPGARRTAGSEGARRGQPCARGPCRRGHARSHDRDARSARSHFDQSRTSIRLISSVRFEKPPCLSGGRALYARSRSARSQKCEFRTKFVMNLSKSWRDCGTIVKTLAFSPQIRNSVLHEPAHANACK